MAGELKHLRSSTTDKRPTASGLGDGRIAINTASGSPGLFFKDNADNIVKVGPVFVGSGAPNASPAVSGSSGNSIGEQWLDTSDGNYVFKIWDGSAWRSEAGEFVNASGDTMTGDLVMNNADLVFEGSTEDGFETVLTVVNPTADNVITLPNITGTVVTTGDNGTVTSGMILDGTIGNAEINANAEIAVSKLASGASNQLLQTNSAGNAVEFTNDVDVPGTLDVTGDTTLDSALDVIGNITASGTIDVSGLLSTNGGVSFSSGTPSSPSLYPGTDSDTGIFSSSGNTIGVATGGQTRLFIKDDGNVGIGTTAPVALLTSSKAVSGGEGGAIAIQNASAGVDTTAALYLAPNIGAGNNLARAASIVSRQTTSGNFADLEFSVSNGTDPVEAMRITSNGRVGIGTTDPIARLDVADSARIGALNTATLPASNAAGGAYFSFNRSAGSAETNITNLFENAGLSFEFLQKTGASSANVLYSMGSPSHVWYISNSEAARIDSSGNVGIGTSSPGNTLTVNGTAKIQNTASFVGLNIANNNDSSSATTTSFIDASNNLGTIDGHLFFEHLTSGGSNAIIATTPAGDRTTDRRVPRLIVGFNGTTTVTSDASTAPFIALINNAEAARIDSSGRLLVGTSSAFGTGAFQVTGGGINLGTYTNNAFSSGIDLIKSRSTTAGQFTIVQSGDELGGIGFRGTDGSAIKTAATIYGVVDGTPGANDMPGRLVFSTTADGASSPTERMRISSDGDVLFGTTEIPNGTSAYGAAFESLPSDRMTLKLATSTTNSSSLVAFYNPNGVVGTIQANGSATAYNTSSDYRLKENVVPLANAADRLNQLQVHRFNFIADPDTTVDGFLAHEAQTVVPECVTGTKDEVDDEGNPVYQGIDQSKIVPLLTAALQEALAKIEALEQRLADAGL